MVSPWGLRGQYSGPVTLMNRLFEAIGSNGRYELDVAFRDRGHEAFADWPRRVFPLLKTGPGRFTRVDQLKWILLVRRFLNRNADAYRYVHIQGAYITNMLAVPRSVRHKLILLPVLEGGDLPTPRGLMARIKDRLYRRVVKNAFLALALSQGIENSLLDLGIPRDRVLRINNPAAVDSRVKRQRTSAAFTVGFVGKIGPNKNPHLVLEALSGLKADGVHARAMFVGPFASAQYEEKFRAVEAQLGLSEQVVTTGFVDDVNHYLDQMDVFVLPSRHEGMPGALAEAITFGLPVVVTDVGEMARHVEAAPAGIVVEAEVSQIVEALHRLSDPLIRYDLSVSARRYGERHFLAAGIAARVQGKIDELEGERPHGE